MNENTFFALLITLFAGLATGIGSLIGFFARKTNTKFLCFSLGLSAGVMIYISFMEMMHGARLELGELLGSDSKGGGLAALLFFGGMILAGVIDRLIPESENPHELHSLEEINGEETQNHAHASHKLRHAGIFSAIALAIHNFPEGIATFVTSYTDLGAGIAIAVAVAIHNIPEGIAVSVPIYHATGSRKRAFWYSFLSGFAEPVGALVAWLILLPLITPMLISCIMAAVAGIMIYIAFDELLPATHYYGENHIALYGLFLGMAIMAASLLIL
jgi:ZIP family zinc transporter